MHTKYLLVLACAGCLFAGASAALAADSDTTVNSEQQNSYDSDATTSETGQGLTQSDTTAHSLTKVGTGNATAETLVNQKGASQDKMATDQATADMSGNGVHEQPAEQAGRVVGTLVDDAGQVQGYVVRAGTTAHGASQFVVVPRELVRAMSSGQSSATQSWPSDQRTRSTGPQAQQRLLRKMYHQLRQQATEIRLLRQQLGMQNAMNDPRLQGTAQVRQDGPLDQIAHIVVDQSGHVQAIVLDSGVILASNRWSTRMQSMDHGNSQGAQGANMAGNAGTGTQSTQARQAIIIFKPSR